MTKIAAAGSRAPDAAAAVREAVSALAAREPDLAFVFLTHDHLAAVDDVIAAVGEALEPAHLLGCVSDGVVAGARELEEGPALALWAAWLPGAEIEPFELGDADYSLPEVDGAALVVLLADPFTFPAGDALDELAQGVPVVGGLATGRVLIGGGESRTGGAVGAVLRGVRVATAVSQGCAPIGRDAVVTEAEENVAYALAGEPALARLEHVISALSDEERLLAARGILAGLVIDENKAEYGRGDYLIRGVLGVDEESGALALGTPLRVGQTLRFHVRDAATADADLRETLAELDGEPAAGALLFTCNGRGTNLFPEPHHDASAVAQALGNDAVAGFFCGGEIGPVGGRAFLHGYTATLAVFLK